MHVVAVAVAGGLVALTALPYLAYLGLYLWVRPSGSPAEKRPAEPSVSVVLPTYNEERIVERKLDDLFDLDYPMERVKVVVVDSSDDDTPGLIREYFAEHAEAGPALNLIRENERRGLAPALNDAYAAADNEMVVKTDCDSFLAADALREAAANLADPEVAAVTGRNADVLGGSEVEAGYRGVQAHVQTLESHLDSTLIFHGPFSAFENDAIVPVDPDSLADDTELALRIRRTRGAARADRDAAGRADGGSADGDVDRGGTGPGNGDRNGDGNGDGGANGNGDGNGTADRGAGGDGTADDGPAYRVIYDPDVRYREASHSAFRKRRKQKDRRGMGLIRLLVQHRDALGRYGNYGRVVLPFNWWFMVVSPWLVALDVLAVTAAVGLVAAPAAGPAVAAVAALAVPLALLGFVFLGQRDLLGPAGPLYSLLDTQVSLLRAAVDLLRGKGDGTWEVDAELREAYD